MSHEQRTLSMSVPTETQPEPNVRRLARMLQPRVGSQVGRFRLDALLGRGSFGWVFKAFDEDLERHVALKILKQHATHEEQELLEEARALAAVQHPSVVKVYEVSAVEGHVVMAMELIEGGTLREWSEQPRHWSEVLAVWAGVFEGLAAAHAAGLIHRDIKPDNVLIDAKGRAVLVDFGLALKAERRGPLGEAAARGGARVADAEASGEPTDEGGNMFSSAPTSVMGTPAYMSPEQMRGDRLDGRTDQFSACVALVEQLCGERPFPSDDPESTYKAIMSGKPAFPNVPGLPWDVRQLILRGLAPAAADRFASTLRLADGLREALRSWRVERTSVNLTVVLGAVGLVPSLVAASTSRPITGAASAALCVLIVCYGQIAKRLRIVFGDHPARAWLIMLAASTHPLFILAALHAERGIVHAFTAWFPPMLWVVCILVAILMGRPRLTLAVGVWAAAQIVVYWWLSDARGSIDQHLNPGAMLFKAFALISLGLLGAFVTRITSHRRSNVNAPVS